MKILHALLTFIGTMLLHWENLQNVSMYMYWCPFQSRKKQWVQAQTRMMSIQNIYTSLLDFLNLKNCSKLTIRNTLHITILKDKYCNILQYGFYWRYPILINSPVYNHLQHVILMHFKIYGCIHWTEEKTSVITLIQLYQKKRSRFHFF